MVRTLKYTALCFVAVMLMASISVKYLIYPGFQLKEFEKSMLLIPAGNYYTPVMEEGQVYKKPGEDSLVNTRMVHLDTFYLCSHEVSNGEYLECLNALYKTDTSQYRLMLPDTLVWRNQSAYNEPYIDYYLRHPAYSLYPVVGVSHRQAMMYCNWLTKKYAAQARRKYRRARFMLPSLVQWVYAARGKKQPDHFQWAGNDLQDNKGNWLANFSAVPQQSIGKATLTVKEQGVLTTKEYIVCGGGSPTGHFISRDASDVTVPVTSYPPNGFGLYNMRGNVEEYISKEGITKGGSWHDTGFYLQIDIHKTYNPADSLQAASATRGFRVAMELTR